MKFSYLFLQSFFTKKLPPPEKLADFLLKRAFEVEEVQKVGNDFVLEIDVLPNRPDCYSHLGMAREIGAILDLKLNFEKGKAKEEKKIKTKDFISLKVKEGCSRYTGKIILNPKIEDSPRWLKERLEICGFQPINNVVDITNYVMLELGQPLHAFDLEKIEGKKIIVRLAKKGEKILTLDEQEYELDSDILIIADTKKPLAIAGIKGGKESGISEKTKIILIESANFEPVIIRRGSFKIDLRTEASLRFSHGLDPNLTEIALERAVYLMQKICGAKVAEGKVDFYPKKEFPKKIKFEKEKVKAILGIEIPEKKILKIFKNLGFKVKKNWEVEIPTFRRDISLSIDLIEEVGRIFGYEKIKSQPPLTQALLPKKNLDLFWENRVKEILVSLGFSEVINYSFCSKEDIEDFGYQKEAIEIENPVSINFQFLRPTLIINLLKNVQKNLSFSKEIKIFEIGKIFKVKDKEKKEKKQLSILLLGEKFFEAKGIVDLLFEKLGISNFYYDFFKPTPEDTKAKIWTKKKAAEIKVNNVEIGFLGELSERILEKFDIKEKVTAIDIDFEKLSQLATEEIEYQPYSIYPAVIRDISVWVPTNVLVEEVMEVMERVGKDLILDIDLFDIYEDQIENKKSLAFRIIFQAKDRALLPEEVNDLQEKIISALEKNPNWEVRKQ